MSDIDQTIAVVTGASRGLGRGIARAFGAKGARVLLTGRAGSVSTAGETALDDAAAEVTAAGGEGIALHCDHGNDADVERAFAQIGKESGHIDILVNNATAIHPDIMQSSAFWELSLHLSDMIDVGGRSNYVASYYAAPLMLEAGRGVIATISFYGAVSYFHGAAYGAAKAGNDKNGTRHGSRSEGA